MDSANNVVYIAHDIETSGPNTKKHDMLALGACVVTQDVLSVAELQIRELCFYAELKPRKFIGVQFELEAMKVACLGLQCLSDLKVSYLNPRNEHFDPERALQVLYGYGQEPRDAMILFMKWVMSVTRGFPLMPVFDTTFYDPPFLKKYLDKYVDCSDLVPPSVSFPYTHKGRDVSAVWEGRAGIGRKLTEVSVQTYDLKEHYARDDAIRIARIAQKLGFHSAGY